MNSIEQSPRIVAAVRDSVVVVLGLLVAVSGFFGHEFVWLVAGA